MSSIKYRTEIDGLRAIAIIAVLFFHVGFTQFSGGFVGVDVFFVISGYLITKILVTDINNNNYSIVDFYEKRIRRIMPALFVVIISVYMLSPLFLSPDDYQFLPKEILGTLLFSNNIISYLKSGYFAADAHQRPLLHTWSLGIEEQFYIILPIILYVLSRYAKKRLPVILIILWLTSLILSISITATHQSASFYLLPTRFWELCSGSIIACISDKRSDNKNVNTLLSVIGLVCILTPIFTYSDSTLFPGYMALPPVIGTVLVLVYSQATLVGRILSLKPMRYLGSISYSLYLWHWPIIVFNNDNFIVNLNLSKIEVVLLSIAIASLSTKYIEAPFRNRAFLTKSNVFKLSIFAYTLLGAMALALIPLKGAMFRFDSKDTYYFNSKNDFSNTRSRCHFDSGLPPASDYCSLGNKKPLPNVIVWGDSHGAEIANAISKSKNVYAVTYSACPPALGFITHERPDCIYHNENVINFIHKTKNIKYVILAANYDKYAKFDGPGFIKGFQKTIKTLSDSGLKVIVLDQIPAPGYNIPRHLANKGDVRFQYHQDAFKKIDVMGSKVFHYEDYLCKKECSILYNGHPISFDDNHLSMSVADMLSTEVLGLLR